MADEYSSTSPRVSYSQATEPFTKRNTYSPSRSPRHSPIIFGTTSPSKSPYGSQSALDLYRNALFDREKRCSALEIELLSEKSKNAELTHKLEETKSRLTAKLEELDKDIKSQMKTNASLRVELNESGTKLRDAQRNLTEYEKAITLLEASKKQSAMLIEKLKGTIAASEAENKILRADLATQDQRHSSNLSGLKETLRSSLSGSDLSQQGTPVPDPPLTSTPHRPSAIRTPTDPQPSDMQHLSRTLQKEQELSQSLTSELVKARLQIKILEDQLHDGGSVSFSPVPSDFSGGMLSRRQSISSDRSSTSTTSSNNSTSMRPRSASENVASLKQKKSFTPTSSPSRKKSTKDDTAERIEALKKHHAKVGKIIHPNQPEMTEAQLMGLSLDMDALMLQANRAHGPADRSKSNQPPPLLSMPGTGDNLKAHGSGRTTPQDLRRKLYDLHGQLGNDNSHLRHLEARVARHYEEQSSLFQELNELKTEMRRISPIPDLKRDERASLFQTVEQLQVPPSPTSSQTSSHH